MSYTPEVKRNDVDSRDFVPRMAHESDMARLDQSNKRLTNALAAVSIISVLVIAFCVFLLYKSNMNWAEMWSSYDYEAEDIMVETGNIGDARYIGNNSNYAEGDGDRYYGEDYGQTQEENQE